MDQSLEKAGHFPRSAFQVLSQDRVHYCIKPGQHVLCHHQKGYWRLNPVFFLGPVHIDSFSICVSKFCTPTGKDIFSINHIVRQFGDSELFLSRNGRKFLQI